MMFFRNRTQSCLPFPLAIFCFSVSVFAQQAPPQGEEYPYPEKIDALPAITEPLAWWMIVLMVVIGLSILGVLIWLLLRETKATPKARPSALMIATGRLEKLRDDLDTVPPAEAAHLVSVILREYQQERYSVPAPYRTSEELYSEGRLQTRKDIQEKFSPLSAIHDRLAFAAQPSTRQEVEDLVNASLEAFKAETDRPFAALAGT